MVHIYAARRRRPIPRHHKSHQMNETVFCQHQDKEVAPGTGGGDEAIKGKQRQR